MENIQVRVTDNFQELTPVEGYVITAWNGEDIMEFSYSTTIVCPLDYDINGFYTITVEEAKEKDEEIAKIIEEINE